MRNLKSSVPRVRTVIPTLALFACLAPSIPRAELVKIDDPAVREDYRRLSPEQKSQADKFFMYSLYEPDLDLRGAFEAGMALSRAKSAGPEAYRMAFNSEWVLTMTLPSRAPLVAAVPKDPANAGTEWTYQKVVDRAMQRASEGNRALTEGKAIATIGEYLLPGYYGKAAKAASKLLERNNGSDSPFIPKQTIDQAYKTAIALAKTIKSDPELAAATQKLLRGYADKELLPFLLAQQLVGKPTPPSPEVAKSAATALKQDVRQTLDYLDRDQRGVVEKATVSQPKLPQRTFEEREELRYHLDEFEGGAKLLSLIVQQHDPRAARQLAVLSNTVVQVGRLYNTPGLGPLALAGGYATIFVAFIQASEVESSAEETRQQLNEIRASLRELSKLIRTGFVDLDNKLDRMFVLTTLDLAAIKEVAADIKQLELQNSDKLDYLSQQAEGVAARLALSTHRRAAADLLDEVDKACSLRMPGGASCKDRLLFALASGTRRVAGLLARDIESKPLIYDVALESADIDALKFLNTLEFGPEVPSITLRYGPSNIQLPGGLPSPDVWLRLVYRLRAQTTVNGLKPDQADKQLLSKIASDGDALTSAYENMGMAVSGELWNEELLALQRLDNAVRKVAFETAIYLDSLGVPFATWEFCSACPETITQASPSIAKFGGSLWDRRRQAFDEFDKVFAADISNYTNDTPEQFHLLSESPNAVLIRYESLPKVFRTRLNIPLIEKLHRLSAGRLYAIVNNVRTVVPLVGWQPGPCDEVMKGSSCVTNSSMTANVKIIFATGPFESDKYIAQSISETWPIVKNVTVALPFIQEFSGSAGRRAISLFELDIQQTIRPIITSRGRDLVNIRQPTLAGSLHYVRLFLSDPKNLGSLRATGQQPVVERIFDSAQDFSRKVVSDIVRAVGIGSTSAHTNPARLVVSESQMLSIQRAAQAARAVRNRWFAGAVFFSPESANYGKRGFGVFGDGFAVELATARRCVASHEAALTLLNRPSSYLTSTERLLLTLNQQRLEDCRFPDYLRRPDFAIPLKDELRSAAEWLHALSR